MFKLLLMICMYYPLSVGLTFYQKWFIKSYRLPLLIVTGHYMTKFFLATFIRFIVECVQKQRRVRIPLQEQLRWLMPIGVCASLDIGLSNWALEYVTVSLYTMAKSSSILFIVLFSLLLSLERWRASLGVEAALIAVGLMLFTWRSTQLDLRGLMLVELAALCTGVRWTISQLIMQGDEQPSPLRHPLDMVVHVQPWMLLAILPMVGVVEGSEMSFNALTYYHGEFQPALILLLILIGGVLAFLMEMSEYLLLVNTSGITLSILGIVKEVITLLLAHYLHGDRLTQINVFGLTLCIGGMALHSWTHASNRKKMSMQMLPNNRFCSSSGSFSPSLGRNEQEDRKLLLYSGDVERI
ncbi:triose-phosphate transporter family domain-containing protein [Ditylenchus destructor]|uniref:Triose-phosphate transporter family domain-containing protein n=1 Tax=Ditylenchus destructor TaxID=166010 RepID=A0AAD4N1Q2_9BILA|nr:triose-phosphate transporter family domain-containing protein [Ditylenchus destructor]